MTLSMVGHLSLAEKERLKAQYYKYYSLSDVPAELLKNEEIFNLYHQPPKEKRSEHPKVIAWKENSTQQSDLGELPINPKEYHYFLILVELSKRCVDGEPIKDKTTQSTMNTFITIFQRGRIKPPTHRLEVDSGKEFDNKLVCNLFTSSSSFKMG